MFGVKGSRLRIWDAGFRIKGSMLRSWNEGTARKGFGTRGLYGGFGKRYWDEEFGVTIQANQATLKRSFVAVNDWSRHLTNFLYCVCARACVRVCEMIVASACVCVRFARCTRLRSSRSERLHFTAATLKSWFERCRPALHRSTHLCWIGSLKSDQMRKSLHQGSRAEVVV